MNIYAFGDIHGEIFKLKALYSRLDIKKDDMLVFLGDYIDRGKSSFEVIDFLCDLSEEHDCVFIRGNHEAMLRDYMSGRDYEHLFWYNGGMITVDSYSEHGYVITEHESYIPDRHMRFFQNLKRYYETDDYIFVHAGIASGPLDRLPDDILYWNRAFNQIIYNGPKVVVYGHTPNNKILNEKYKICIDTGACYDSMGDLTCVKLPERVFYRQGWTMEDEEHDRDGN
jgi:serine/threonine protein phosphatase 1